MPSFRRDVVVAGASAGGVEAPGALAGSLPPDFRAAILVSMHLSPSATTPVPGHVCPDCQGSLVERLNEQPQRGRPGILSGHYVNTAREYRAAAETLRTFLLSRHLESLAEAEP